MVNKEARQEIIDEALSDLKHVSDCFAEYEKEHDPFWLNQAKSWAGLATLGLIRTKQEAAS